jgi:hypothetical protein
MASDIEDLQYGGYIWIYKRRRCSL